MSPIQYILACFALFAVVRLFLQFRKGHVRLGGLVVWLVVWGGLLVVAILPQTTTLVARLVGVGRGADAVIYASIAGLFYVVFRLYVKQEEHERALVRFVRHAALEEAFKNEQQNL